MQVDKGPVNEALAGWTGVEHRKKERPMLKKNLTTVFAIALVAFAVPALAQAGTASDVDIANDNLLYSVQPGDMAAASSDFDINEAFGDLYDESILSSQRDVEDARTDARSEQGTVDYTMKGNWAVSCDNYL
jgi:hypothetical protein